MPLELNHDKLVRRINAIEALETKAASLREELQEPLGEILKIAGLGHLSYGEKITAMWETGEGGLHISTEQTRGEWDTFSYTIPGCIITAADPMAAASEYRRQKASEADDKRRAATKAEIARLQATL